LLPLPPQLRLKKAVEDFVSDSFSAVLRRDYLELINSLSAGVEGKIQRCAATLITYYRHWQEWKQEHQRTDWLYQPLRQIYKDLMELFSIPVIRAANDLLIELGLLLRRGNPGNRQDKTYQYNVLFDRITQLLAEPLAASSFEKTDVSAAIPNFSASPANTHHNIQSNRVTSSNQDVIEEKEPESNQEVVSSITQVEILTSTKEQSEVCRFIAESLGEAQSPAPASLDSDEVMRVAESIDGLTAINVASEFLGELNTEAERKKRSGYERIPRPLCIPGLDESAHEILWKYQAQLEKLNADLNAERIKSAIADHPQYLESAILALIENSATGAKTPEAATGFLYNALRQGWKPRQSSSSASVSVQVYTPPPQMLSTPKPSTLEELVERKRAMWRHAPILRSSIEAWVEQTRGLVMTHDGPALANAANAGARLDPEPNEAEHLETPDEADFTPPEENALSPQLDPDTPLEVEQLVDWSSEQPHLEVNQVDNVASNQTPATAAPPTEPAPHQPPDADSAGVESPTRTTEAERKQRQGNRWLQPVEILTSAGEWSSGYFVHRSFAVANLVGSEQRFKLFDANGESYIFFGQIRPPSEGLKSGQGIATSGTDAPDRQAQGSRGFLSSG